MKYVYKKKILILFALIFDFLGTVISWPFRRFNPPSLPEKVSRILLVRMDHIGDIIISTAVLKPLREAYPDGRIDFAVPSWGKGLINDNPYVSGVVEFDPVWFDRKRSAGLFSQIKGVIDLVGIIKKGKYDAVIDLRGDLRHIFSSLMAGVKCRISYGITGGGFLLSHEVPYREGVHEIEHNMDLVRVLGASSEKAEISLLTSGEAEKRSREVLLESNISAPYAVFHVAPGHATKIWEKRNFSRTIDYIAGEKNTTAVLVGSKKDGKIINDIVSAAEKKAYDLSGKTDLKALTGVLKGASLFVGVDSAPAHIAAAFGVPTVVLFSGVNDPGQWAPKGENVKIVCPGRGKDLSVVSPERVCRVIDEMMGKDTADGSPQKMK